MVTGVHCGGRNGLVADDEHRLGGKENCENWE